MDIFDLTIKYHVMLYSYFPKRSAAGHHDHPITHIYDTLKGELYLG